jgi:hypothetical protein
MCQHSAYLSPDRIASHLHPYGHQDASLVPGRRQESGAFWNPCLPILVGYIIRLPYVWVFFKNILKMIFDEFRFFEMLNMSPRGVPQNSEMVNISDAVEHFDILKF